MNYMSTLHDALPIFISYIGDWNGHRFFVQDTGGWDPNAKGIHGAIARQAEVAMETADVIIFVVDTNVGITETDSVMARKLQRSEVPVILVANKFDSDSMYADMAEFYGLGLGDRSEERRVGIVVA